MRAAAAAVLLALLPARCLALIDRQRVVSRHDPVVLAASSADLDTMFDVFSVGNGAFGFNADITGLQSFNESYTHLGVNTLADWGWHTTPYSAADPTYALRDYNMTYYATPTDGVNGTRQVPYFNADANDPAVVAWLMGNPHRLNLGQISLRWAGGGGGVTTALELTSVVNASQRLSLWEGVLRSNFTLSAPAAVTCAVVDDNNVATFDCSPGGGVITGVIWASYGQPTGTCATGFDASPTCNAANSSAVLAAICVGKPSCSLLVNWQAGFGDPCAGKAKLLAANVTCSVTPAPAAAPAAVSVQTAVHPDADLVSVSVTCTADAADAPCPLALRLAFPYGTAAASSGANWSAPGAHTTVVAANASGGAGGRGGATLLRQLDGDAYRVDCAWDGGLVLLAVPGVPHAFDLVASGAQWTAASVSCLYSPAAGLGGPLVYPVGAWMPWLVEKATVTRTLLAGAAGVALPLFPTVAQAASAFWAGFWGSGAFVDLASANSDPLALELERRVVLSQYLMRANEAGAEPPQETGLLVNSWNGKHHNEMRYWHAAHWSLWGRPELLARSDGFYFDQLPNATSYAALQGYPGAHWPKETGAVANRSGGGIDVPWLGLDHSAWPFGGAPNGSLLVWESPQVANALVIWQQPHPIWLADVQRRAANASGGPAAAQAVVVAQAPLVLATADYLAARMFYNASSGRYRLGPPVMGGQECGNVQRTFDPVFELVYIGLVLDIANAWRGWLGLPADPLYEAVASHLAELHTDPASPPGAPLYTFDAGCVCQFLPGGVGCDPRWVPEGGNNCAPLHEHPLMLGMFGMINGRAFGDRYGLNATTMNSTLAAVWANWPAWTGAWGWDDSLIASAMTRLGWDPVVIVAGPLNDTKFPYYKNGHTLCCPVYMPGNGGLLLSVAMLAAGSDTSPPMYFPPAWGAVAEGFTVPYP